MPVGKNIRTARKNIVMSQGDLAKEVDVALDTISRWETGKRTPRTEDLLKLSKILGVSVSYLMGETGNTAVVFTESSIEENDTMLRREKKEMLIAK